MKEYSSVPSASCDRTTSSERPFLSPEGQTENSSQLRERDDSSPVTTKTKKKGMYNALVMQYDTKDDDDEEMADGAPSSSSSGAKAIDDENDDFFIDTPSAAVVATNSGNESYCWNSFISQCGRFFQQNWTKDRSVEWNGHVLLELEAVKFFKLLALTFVGFVVIHYLVRWMNWEIDPDFTLHDLILYDLNYIVLDVMVFYCVGRLYKSRGVDHLNFIIPATVAAIYSSWANTFDMFKHSFSMYEMHCKWPVHLWIFVFIMVPFVTILVWMYVREASRQGILVRKLVEFLLTIIIFILPYASHPNFHLHHWYFGMLLGMHTYLNGDIWWSRATMGYLWGLYINGIAVYGRDPILTCAYAFYTSTDQHCPYMACYKPEQNANANATDYKPMEKPNWRDCTGYIP